MRSNIVLRGLALVICFIVSIILTILSTMDNTASEIYDKNVEPRTIENGKYAYVLHIRSREELCFALANSALVAKADPPVDVMWLMPLEMQTERLPLPANVTLYSSPEINDGYHETFVRFEPFGFMSYDRVIVSNADYVITPGLDKLFRLDLEGRSVATFAAPADRTPLTLSSALMVVSPSQQLYESVSIYQGTYQVEEAVAAFNFAANTYSNPATLYEDCILNKALNLENVKILPRNLEELGISSYEVEQYNDEVRAYCVIYTNAPLW